MIYLIVPFSQIFLISSSKECLLSIRFDALNSPASIFFDALKSEDEEPPLPSALSITNWEKQWQLLAESEEETVAKVVMKFINAWIAVQVGTDY